MADAETAPEQHDVETEAPKADPSTGVAMDGDYPHNHRLRAEALAKARRKTDPDGLISDELIADAKERLAAARDEKPATPDASSDAA